MAQLTAGSKPACLRLRRGSLPPATRGADPTHLLERAYDISKRPPARFIWISSESLQDIRDAALLRKLQDVCVRGLRRQRFPHAAGKHCEPRYVYRFICAI